MSLRQWVQGTVMDVAGIEIERGVQVHASGYLFVAVLSVPPSSFGELGRLPGKADSLELSLSAVCWTAAVRRDGPWAHMLTIFFKLHRSSSVPRHAGSAGIGYLGYLLPPVTFCHL
ncbi:hypothetical protein L198_02064 [Cryptococcus wingfieldii CBS 7118]|uniref:Uncharacterized protein n=1 Tax=Cryptococcus wingfieldii CBS 7118 TaxID=1295528 RepID=A0A1E3JX23_9TREE|nr:hypothetical protein L198_02064 [Cryptococcus wingfieldii CBS 7118]ODO05371.1 hypothetical protein L198_02064 [Cryptococcus wingfieldii CBS 7118]